MSNTYSKEISVAYYVFSWYSHTLKQCMHQSPNTLKILRNYFKIQHSKPYINNETITFWSRKVLK